MKSSYHVFASPKKGIPEAQLESQLRAFLESQILGNHMVSYRILKHSENGNLEGLPRYQIICDYESEEALKLGFAGMKPDAFKQEPHLSLMSMVTDFRVGFTSDI